MLPSTHLIHALPSPRTYPTLQSHSTRSTHTYTLIIYPLQLDAIEANVQAQEEALGIPPPPQSMAVTWEDEEEDKAEVAAPAEEAGEEGGEENLQEKDQEEDQEEDAAPMEVENENKDAAVAAAAATAAAKKKQKELKKKKKSEVRLLYGCCTGL